MSREDRAQSGPVSNEGEIVRQRRERLGMHKNELAESAGVSRDTLAAIEAGEGFRRASLTKIERALDAAEAEAGIDPGTPQRRAEDRAPQPRVIRLKDGDLEVVLEDTGQSDEELIALALHLLAGMKHLED